ncbi:MAG: penicillin-binding protein 1A [Verrucomicrobia bacterium]|nr:MAG: penicillin-binding protein 1A [Verrucomicrobiota bacterium]
MPELTNQRRKRNRFSGFLMLFLKASAALCLLAAALGIWFYGAWKLKARALDYRRLKEMESGSLILDRSGEIIGRIFTKNRDEKPLADLSKLLQQAVVSSEDSRFFSHSGVDYYGIARAIFRNSASRLQGRKSREGASTLTQQLARNTFTEDLPSKDRSIRRKVFEMFVAWEVENRLTKIQILELYLNRVFFGSSFYGAEAAAQGYFGKSAKELSPSEAALLAGLLRSPNQLSPWQNRKKCIDARNHVLFRMHELGSLSDAAYQEALAEEPVIKNKKSVLQESYFAAMVSAQMAELVGLENALSGGYRIYTSIDLKLQRTAESALQKQLETLEARPEFKDRQTYAAFDPIYRAWKKRVQAGAEEAPPKPEYLQGAVVVLDNATGAIRALVGGRDVKHSEFNRATQSKKPPGSAFKPIVYAAAFESGLHPWSMVQDSVMDNRKVMIGGTSGILGEWAREEANTPFEGMVTAQNALLKSKNAATVRLGMMIGNDLKTSLDAVSTVAKATGIQSPTRAFPSTFLGSTEMSLMELSLAYSSFSGDGSRPTKPFIIERVEDNAGKPLPKENATRQNALKPATAHQITESLMAALSEGTGARAFSSLGLKRLPLAGKTGTAYDFTDVWFMGYSSALTCGVWSGFDKSRTPIFYGAFGSDIALPVWTEVMNASFENYPPKPFRRPEDLRKCRICASSGYTLLPSCLETAQDGSQVSTAKEVWLSANQIPLPEETCDVHGPKRPKRHSGEDGAQPKVELAVDLSGITAISLKSPTVLGEDPFFSSRSEQSARALKNFRDTGRAAPLDNRLPDAGSPDALQQTDVPKVQAVRPGESSPNQLPQKNQPNLPRLEF